MTYDFRFDGYYDPAPEVFDNGLPELPGILEVGFGIAVARWVDGDFGIVLVVTHQGTDEFEEEEFDDEYDYDVQPYLRVNGTWAATDASGGSSWPDPPFERPAALRPLAATCEHLHHQYANGQSIRVVNGLAGEDVASVEIVSGERTSRMPVESPIGAWVAGLIGNEPAQWFARDAHGQVVGSGDVSPLAFGGTELIQGHKGSAGWS